LASISDPVGASRAILAVDRIHGLEVSKETFATDSAIDVKRYEAEAFGVVWERPMTVVVRFRADQAPYVREREWHPTQRLLSPLMGNACLQRLVVRGPAAEVTAFRQAVASRAKPEYMTIGRACRTQKLSFAKLRTLIPGKPARRIKGDIEEPCDLVVDPARRHTDGSLELTYRFQLSALIEALTGNPDRAEDVLIYLLLGYSQHTVDRTRVVNACGAHLPGRSYVFCARELIAKLGNPSIIPGTGDSHRDARDLTVAYRDLLLRLEGRLERFGQRPSRQWDEGDFYGFFARCVERVDAMRGARMSYVPNRGGASTHVGGDPSRSRNRSSSICIWRTRSCA
jgi:hypothetical protein